MKRMKRLIAAAAVCLCLMGAAMPAMAIEPKETEDIILPATLSFTPSDKSYDDQNYAGFCGRLVIPETNIDVAMYNSLAQAVCDRADSACCFSISPYYGQIIADHSDQDFRTLTQVQVGTLGAIQQTNGDMTIIVCMEAFQGHNTGSTITDNDYNIAFGKYDYLTYTCLNCWQNVQVCQWKILGTWSQEEQAFLGFRESAGLEALLA